MLLSSERLSKPRRKRLLLPRRKNSLLLRNPKRRSQKASQPRKARREEKVERSNED